MILALEQQQLSDPLLAVGAAVDQLRVAGQGAGEHAQQADPAAVRIGDRLEHVRQRLCPAALGHVARPGRRRQALDDQVEQAVRADVAGRGTAADREHAPLRDQLLERLSHLLARDLAALQVALHQLVGGFGDHVHQLVVVLVGQLAQLVGDRHRLVMAGGVAPVQVGDHVHQVDHAMEVALGSDRDLDRHAGLGQPLAQLLERRVGVGSLAVEQVHQHQPRDPQLIAAPPETLGAHLDPHHAGHRHDRTLDHPQRAQDVGLEAGLAGRIDQVDGASLPLQVRHRSRDRHAALALVLVVVGDGCLLGHAAEPVDGARLVQERLD